MRFVDLNDEAIAALREEVGLQRQAFSLSFVGLPANCTAAVQDIKDQIQVFAYPPPFATSMQPIVQDVLWSGMANFSVLTNQTTYVTPPTDRHMTVVRFVM